jgi:NhaP-type Na+/H+ or K+/H+ antiporter
VGAGDRARRAVVAPPDAAAATAVLRHLQLPRRILTILEGEPAERRQRS